MKGEQAPILSAAVHGTEGGEIKINPAGQQGHSLSPPHRSGRPLPALPVTQSRLHGKSGRVGDRVWVQTPTLPPVPGLSWENPLTLMPLFSWLFKGSLRRGRECQRLPGDGVGFVSHISELPVDTQGPAGAGRGETAPRGQGPGSLLAGLSDRPLYRQ